MVQQALSRELAHSEECPCHRKLVENCILVGNPDLGAATGGVENCVFEVVTDLGAAIG